MPSVANQTADEPVKLAKVEVAPGVVLKLSPKDAAAYKARQEADAASAAAYSALVSGAATPEVETAAGPAEVPLTVLSKAELVSLAEARGLATSGNKAAIAARFGDSPVDEPDEAPEAGADGGAEAGAPAGAAPDATAAIE